jgi:hypothetical protein
MAAEDPMALVLRLLLLAAGALAALFVARDAPNFGVVQGLLAVGILAAAVVAAALIRRR